MQNETPAVSSPDPEREGVSLAEDLRLLADEAKVFAKAEMALQKAKAAFAGKELRKIVALLAVAAIVLFFAAMAFVVGLVLALAPLLTAWGAMAVVSLALLVLAALCALAARRALGTMKRVLSGERLENHA